MGRARPPNKRREARADCKVTIKECGPDCGVAQNPVVRLTRIARGEPGVMLVLLLAEA